MTAKRPHTARLPWPSQHQVRDVLALGEQAIEAHQEQAVRLTRDLTFGTITPRTLAEESSRFYERLSSDWTRAVRILFRRTHEQD